MTTFIIEQRVTAFANQYRVFSADNSGNKGDLVAFAHQKRLAFKEEILFYTDEKKSQLAFKVKAENVIDFHGKFIVRDTNDAPLGAVRKAFKASLTRSTWEILSTGDEIVSIVQESNPHVAIFRRAWNFIPFLNDIPFIMKYHFDFMSPDLQTTYGKHAKTSLLFDHFNLSYDETSELRNVDWRVLIAQAVLLDALQGR
jgi:hypothetical protein